MPKKNIDPLSPVYKKWGREPGGEIQGTNRYLNEAICIIDELLGEDYAKQNPLLVSEVMKMYFEKQKDIAKNIKEAIKNGTYKF